MNDEGEYIGQALIHAFVTNPQNECIDARGKLTREEIEADYDWNTPLFRRVTKDEVHTYLLNGFLESPKVGESEQLKNHINEHIHLYK